MSAVRSPQEMEQEAERLNNCRLVYFERQGTTDRWIGPAGEQRHNEARINVKPLTHVQPAPGIEIHAHDGEHYLIPANFKGTWLEVISPKGVQLIE